MTGTTGGLGLVLAERLDAGQGLAGGAVRRIGCVHAPALAGQLAGVRTVVHLATTYDVSLPAAERRTVNVTGTARLIEAAHGAGVQRVVLTTSAEVWRAPGVGVARADADPVAGSPDDTALVGDHVEMERLATQARLAGLQVTVLRPATLVAGALGRTYDGQLLRQLGAPRLLALRGVEPLWQLCHADDLLAALALVALGLGSRGAELPEGLGVGCEGSLPQRRVEAMSGRRRLELPQSVAMATAERLHRLGVTTSSPRELDYLHWPLVLACDGLRSAGWAPAWSNETALQAHLSARSGDGRAGAATAASATLAVVGTAALVRRTRRHRQHR